MGAQCLSFFLLLSLAYLQSSLGLVPRLPNVMEVSFGTGIHQNRLPELNVDEVVKCFENVITNEGTVLITTDYDVSRRAYDLLSYVSINISACAKDVCFLEKDLEMRMMQKMWSLCENPST